MEDDVMIGWIKKRAVERSTWLGIITLATIGGLNISAEQKELIISIGTALGALVMTFTADPKPPAPDWRAPEATQQQIISTPDIDPNMGVKG